MIALIRTKSIKDLIEHWAKTAKFEVKGSMPEQDPIWAWLTNGKGNEFMVLEENVFNKMYPSASEGNVQGVVFWVWPKNFDQAWATVQEQATAGYGKKIIHEPITSDWGTRLYTIQDINGMIITFEEQKENGVE
ncbi:hypothetical protein QUF88_21860 [Bacillus sp. DX1.1]|uniref:hypothetical protein n=1 Tax=unclassified Bacillus (in: firmicutes) TaxID=185979 RepID=UPI0025712E45|nr:MULTISPECIES: hypothetical protein [unclassified Bacillus (in: firmicutes)]MDM5156360.1 hypothetical protein [Bacillus sp. DX1.1]WJE80632.1 hypothetical protein QRE67_19395 [Bacillus sp. DX3.1]